MTITFKQRLIYILKPLAAYMYLKFLHFRLRKIFSRSAYKYVSVCPIGKSRSKNYEALANVRMRTSEILLSAGGNHIRLKIYSTLGNSDESLIA